MYRDFFKFNYWFGIKKHNQRQNLRDFENEDDYYAYLDEYKKTDELFWHERTKNIDTIYAKIYDIF